METDKTRANIDYLKRNNVSVDEINYSNGNSYELGLYTPSGGDFSITIDEEELTCYDVCEYLRNYDVSDETRLWWDSEFSPFDNIRDLYDDIEAWRTNFLAIAENMPY